MRSSPQKPQYRGCAVGLSRMTVSPPGVYILCHRRKPSTMFLQFLNKSLFFFSYLINCQLSSSEDSMGWTMSQEDKRWYQEAQSKPSAPNIASSGMSVSMPPIIWGSPFAAAAVFLVITRVLTCPQPQIQWNSLAGRRQPFLTSPKVAAWHQAFEWAFSALHWERS